MSEKEKHTPGPWKIAPPITTGIDKTVVACHSQLGAVPVAYISSLGVVDGDSFANARLIAAAPVMLAALQAIAKHHARYDDLTDAAARALRDGRAAIRAALSEGD